MRAMILAAGFGTRLWPLTEDRTKPAIPFLGRPLVGYVAEYLAGYGFDEVVVNLHHRPESVREALGDGSRFGVRLFYVEEKEILGTSGALDNARHLLDGDTFIVVNGKIITDINLQQALATHRRTQALATLVLLPNTRRERFSIVETSDGLVTGFGGMPQPPKESDNAGDDNDASADADERGAPLMFTGIQILEPRIFDYIPRGVFSHSTTDVYPQAIARGERIAAHVTDGMWYELSTIERYLEISLAVMAREGRDCEIGAGSVVSTDAEVRESVLWESVRVDEGARLRRVILGDGVHVRAGEVFENAALVRAELVEGVVPPEKALRGEVRGSNFVVPLP
jgi:NDP-sugar pyrophosphorylase family protein